MSNKCGEYNIGDVVRITNKGGLYTTYKFAIKYFNVTNVSAYDGYSLKVVIPEDFDENNWVIVNKAIHYNAMAHKNNGVYEYDVVYCVENHRKERLITSSHYFKLRPNVKTPYTERLKKLNEFFLPIYLGM